MNVYKNIMIIDDDEDVREAIAVSLDDLEVFYTLVSNNTEALNLAMSENIDLIITDLALTDKWAGSYRLYF